MRLRDNPLFPAVALLVMANIMLLFLILAYSSRLASTTIQALEETDAHWNCVDRLKMLRQAER